MVDGEIKKRTENQHRGQSNDYSEPIRQLEINTKHDHRKGPQHGKVPLSEIDHVGSPIDEDESKRDQGINTADAKASEEKLESYAHKRLGGQRFRAGCPPRADSLFAEVDMLDEHDLAVIVFDDVVAVQPIAVLIKIVDAFGTRVAFDAQDHLSDL